MKTIPLMALSWFKWLLAGSLTVLHPFFVSVTEMNHNAHDKILEISCKTFTDDLEKAIEKSAGTRLDLFNVKDKAVADKAISEYIKKHLQLSIDGKPQQLEFIGFEREGEATWSYLQVPNVASIKKIEVTNVLLREVSADEINIMHVTVGGTRKSTKLDFPNSHVSFEF